MNFLRILLVGIGAWLCAVPNVFAEDWLIPLKKVENFVTNYVSTEGGQSTAKEEVLIPLKKVESFKEGYSAEELELIKADLNVVTQIVFQKAVSSPETLEYIATAGGPGAGKSTILEKYIEGRQKFVYLDPDQRGLKLMPNTYGIGFNCLAVSRHPSFQDLARKQYTKWRRAGRYITFMLLNQAFQKGYSIAHGTTLTDEEVEKHFIKLKGKGYKLTFLLCGSTDENRAAAVKHREQNQGFVQSTQKDFVEKGKIFFQKFPLYFKYADHIRFYWVDNFAHGAVEWGEWSKGENLIIYDDDAQAKFVQAYENYRVTEKPELPSLETLIKGRGL